MTKKTAESALGIMWLNICATDGNMKSLLKDRDVDDDTKHRLLTTYLRLRLKGFTTDALAKVDPTNLMAHDVVQVDQAIRELPKVEEDDDDDDDTFDPFEDLDENMREEVIAFQERQNQREMEQRLGLRAS